MLQVLFGQSWPEALMPSSRRGRYPGSTIERVFLPQVLIGEPQPRYNYPPINQGPGLPGYQLKGYGWDHGYHLCPLTVNLLIVTATDRVSLRNILGYCSTARITDDTHALQRWCRWYSGDRHALHPVHGQGSKNSDDGAVCCVGIPALTCRTGVSYLRLILRLLCAQQHNRNTT